MSYGIISIKGLRRNMEDTFVIENKDFPVETTMIFDGHSGGETSSYLKKMCPDKLKTLLLQNKHPTINDFETLFHEIDADFLKLNKPSGSAANIALFYKDTIKILNCGDCQTMVVYKDGSYKISKPHRPEFEINRLLKLGVLVGVINYTRKTPISPIVTTITINSKLLGKNVNIKERFKETASVLKYPNNMWRIKLPNSNYALNLSRSFGDSALKKWVISTPDNVDFPCKNGVFFIQACDGLWDFVNPTEVRLLYNKYNDQSNQVIANKIRDYAMNKKKCSDNLTIICKKLSY